MCYILGLIDEEERNKISFTKKLGMVLALVLVLVVIAIVWQKYGHWQEIWQGLCSNLARFDCWARQPLTGHAKIAALALLTLFGLASVWLSSRKLER